MTVIPDGWVETELGYVADSIQYGYTAKSSSENIGPHFLRIFYAQGVKANVLFFDNRPASKTAATKDVWYYDYRTNIHHTLKRSPLRLEDLREFITCYNPTNRHKRKKTWHPEKNPDGR